MKRKAIYDQYGVKGLKEGVQSKEGKYFLTKDFAGYPGGYAFHGDGELVFSEFFGTKNPFAGILSKFNARLFCWTGQLAIKRYLWEKVWRFAWSIKHFCT